MAGVTLKQITKRYTNVPVIHGLDLCVKPGEFCVFVGPSGCGKSTLLRMIAGLEEPSSGSIHIGERDVTHVDAADRGTAMVFQTYALYPHMTVEENIGFGLKMNNVPKTEIVAKVKAVAQILKLQAYMQRKPKALSGGQRQRVAIGRALVRDPQVFLFDEPLSNLDAELRVNMRVEIARLHKEIGATMIYVTHDQVEAMTLADKIVLLRAGVIEQIGSPMALYTNPDNKFVAGFMGSPSMNFISGIVQTDQSIACALTGHVINAPAQANDKVLMGLRPEYLSIDLQGQGLTVEIVEKLGGVAYVHAHTTSGEKLVIEHKSLNLPDVGAEIGVRFSTENIYFFNPETGVRLR